MLSYCLSFDDLMAHVGNIESSIDCISVHQLLIFGVQAVAILEVMQVHGNFAHPRTSRGELARWQQAFQSLKDGFLQKIRTDVSWCRPHSIHQHNSCNYIDLCFYMYIDFQCV